MDSVKKKLSNFVFNLKYFFGNILYIILELKNLKFRDIKIIFKNIISFLFSRRFIFSHYFMMTLIFILTLTSIYLFYSRFRVAEAGDPWFNDLWKKRQKIQVINTSNQQVTNFIAEASLPGSALINAGVLNGDCSDIRVIDTSLNVMDYWVDLESCNQSVTKIYFKIPTLYDIDDGANGVNTFFVYYGNQIASPGTVAQTDLFLATIPNLKLNYDFDSFNNNVVIDKSGLGNNGNIINSSLTYPDGSDIINNSTFPEGYYKNAFFFNGYNVFISTPVRMVDLTKAYTMLTFIKPQGTRANGYIIQNESMGKMFNFENIYKVGSTCNAAEYNESDGAGGCIPNGVLFTPDLITPKKTGTYNHFYDFYWDRLTRPSRSVTFDGSTDYLYQNNPVNFIPLLSLRPGFGFKYKLKLEGNVGDFRSIHSWGNTSPGNYSYALDYSVCSDGSLRFSLDYNNSRNNNSTLATPCLNNLSPSQNISTNAGKYAIIVNSNKWLDVVTAHIENKRYIFVNGIVVASDASPNVFIERENVTLYIGKPSNENKGFLQGEIDEYVSFGQDQDWFNNNFFTSGSFNSSLEQYATNITKKSYVIFGNNHNNFFKAGFSNHANSRYNTATAISNFNYNFNTSDSDDYYQQYGGNIDNTLNRNPSFISSTFNLFDGKWFRYYTEFDDKRDSIASSYLYGNSTYSYEQRYRSTNANGVLTIGAYVNTDDDTATHPSEFFFGGMDDVFVYSATLSSTQLTYHSQPWNGYASYGKTLWQSPLSSAAIGTISFSQNFDEESLNYAWYDKNYPFRVQVDVFSLPILNTPNFQVTFNFDTSTPISNQRMNSDCSGIIITDDFNRVLPYWIGGCNTTSSLVYLKLNPDDSENTNAAYSIKGGANQRLFIYYGNEKSTAKTYPVTQVMDITIPGLEIAYTFEDDTTTISYDKSGNGRDLRKRSGTNTSPASEGAFFNSLIFNGTTNYGSTPFPDATIRTWSGISTLMWGKPDFDGVNRNPFVQQFNGTRYLQYRAAGTDFSLRTQLYGTELSGLTQTGTDSIYYFFGTSWEFGSGNYVKSILNNNIKSEPNSTLFQSFPNTGDGLFIGALCCNPGLQTFWSGALDEIRVYSRALTDTELNAYTANTTIGIGASDATNTCRVINGYCTKSFVTPYFPDTELLGKYNSNVIVSTNAETRINTPYVYLKFNEGTGVVVNDSSNRIGYSYLGANINNPIITGEEPNWSSENKCIEGECLYFDGINDYVRLGTVPGSPYPETFLVTNSNFTYSIWVKPLSNPNSRQTIISFGPNSTKEAYALYLDSSMRLVFGGEGYTSNSSASSLPISKWSHVTLSVSKDNGSNSFYINGNLDKTNLDSCISSDTCFTTTLINKWYLGRNAASTSREVLDPFRGYMDEFKFFKTDLGLEDVQEEYRKGLNTLKYNLSVDQDTVTNFNLMAYYPFDEFDRSVAFDYSGNNAEASYPSSDYLNFPGIFNNAFSSPGIGTDTVQIPNSSFINLTSQATYSLWVKVTNSSTDDKYLIYKSGTGGYSIKYNSTTQKYTGNICGVDLTSTNTFSINSWDHIVLTSNSKKAKLFVNSVMEKEDYCFNNYVGSSTNTAVLRVGGDGTSNGTLEGLIDEFRIYDNYLSNKQVQLLFSYRPTYSAYGARPVAFYKLDASAGTTTAVDASGNNNTLTMFVPATNQNSWSTFGKIGNSYDFTTNASTTKNLFSATSSTMTTGPTQPHSMMGWVAFSEPFYGNYAIAYPGSIIGLGNAATSNTYSTLTYDANSRRVLDLRMWNNNADNLRLSFSSPYLSLTMGAKNPIWYHVAGTFDGNLRKIYINGELVNVDSGSSTAFSISTSGIVLGGLMGNYTTTQFQFNGLLDEAKIYNYARTQDQIKMDMRNASTAPALSANFYNTIRNNQRPSVLNTAGDSNIYPIVDLNFDSYFGINSILFGNRIITSIPLTNVNFYNIPAGVSNFQLEFSVPISTYNVGEFSDANCSNIIINRESTLFNLRYWAVPNSCGNGTGVFVVNVPTTSNTESFNVILDTGTTPSGQFNNYVSTTGQIFDYTIPNLEVAHNFEETSGDWSYDSSGNDRNIRWFARNNISTGAFGRAPFLDGTNHYGSMALDMVSIRTESWPGVSLFGWIWRAASKNMNVFDLARIDNYNYFRYGNSYTSSNTSNYQRTIIGNTTDILGNNFGSLFLYRGFSLNFQVDINNLKIYDDGNVGGTHTVRDGAGQNLYNFPTTTYNLACIGRASTNLTGVCTSNLEGWLGSFDELRIFSRELSINEYRAYLNNSTGSYTPLGSSGVIGAGVSDATNICNLSGGWCTKSFVTPSFPTIDLLGKYNSNIYAVYSDIPQLPVFSAANNGAVYANGEGVRGGAAFFQTAGTEKNIDFVSADFLNFLQGSNAAISFYIKPANTGTGSIASSTGLKINKLANNQVNFSGAGFNITSTRVLPAGTWSHVFFQKSGLTGVFELYVNNELQGTAYDEQNLLDMSDLKFTVTEGADYYLDELKIYNAVLNPVLITNLYNGGYALRMGLERSTSCVSGSSSYCSTPTNEFLFNESSGNVAYNNIRDGLDIDQVQVLNRFGESTSRATGYLGRGLYFDGQDSSTIGTNFINNSGEGSFSFWYKSSDTNTTLFSGKNLSITTSDEFKGINFSTTNLGSKYADSSWSDLHVNPGKYPWRHILVSYNTSVTPAEYSFYLDGVYLFSHTFTKNTNTEKWFKGIGSLDNLRFFNYQRNASQVAQEYAGGAPFAHFKLDECSGSKLYNSNSHLYRPLQYRESGSRTDAQAYLNTGLTISSTSGVTNFNTNLCLPGKYNKSFYFDTTTYMSGNDYHSRIFNSDGNATITFWINPDDNTSQNVNLISSLDGTDSHQIKLENRKIKVYASETSTDLKVSSTSDISATDWTHVAVVFDNSDTYKLYINGLLEATSASGSYNSILNTCTGGAPVSCVNNPFVIGKGYKGKLDEIKVYNYPLTQQQIKIDMNQNSAVRVQ